MSTHRDSVDLEGATANTIMTLQEKIQNLQERYPEAYRCVGEFLGTFLLVLFGVGSVTSAVITGSLQGLWQVAVVWGFGVSVSIWCTAAISGAHLNPAITIAMAIFRARDNPWHRVPGYVLSQLLGAVCAGSVVYALYSPFVAEFETRNEIVRGAEGSELSAMILCEYFPNPAMYGPSLSDKATALVTPAAAMTVEMFGTAILAFIIFALTDRCQDVTTPPYYIGFSVSILISLFAPITQAGWNPARDFGPRLVAYWVGWGSVAFPGPHNGWWVYVVGPILGALIGAAVHDLFLKRRVCKPDEKCK
eukprot:GFYU01019331.1.p1 GENE.GFYU01019331.1~~GFYU01019331.1.p1  ORF type:complete len:306 (-),score=64.93 GFYU01019331.1:76-993(-)